MSDGRIAKGILIDLEMGEALPVPDHLYADYVPERIYLAMRQGVGISCTPVVKLGDKVCRNQLVGEAAKGISANVHCGIAGTVVDIREVPQPAGMTATTVVIENDGSEHAVEGRGNADWPGADELWEIVAQAGIVGMGGAGFPTHVKLQRASGIETCIANGAECEPLIHADNVLMLVRAEAIVDGCLLVMRAIGAGHGVIAIEDDKEAAIARVRKVCEGHPDLDVRVLPHRYPMGGEKQLIPAIVGREYSREKLPADMGVLVLNVATLAAISDAVRHGQPLTHRFCSVAGDVLEPRNLRCPVGTRLGDLLSFCCGWRGRVGKVVLGGPMMGKTVENLEVPLGKTANGVVVFSQNRHEEWQEYSCIRCNRCSEACPMLLMPQFIDRSQRRRDWESCRRLQAESCINCGCCTYVCPSRIPLAANIIETVRRLKEKVE